MHRTAGRTLTLAAAAATLALSACSAGGGASDAGPHRSTTTVAPPTTSGTGRVLDALVISESELRDGEALQQREDGKGADGYVTLDYCGYTFESEGERTDRRQVDVVDDSGDQVGSSEAVSYGSGGAERAVAEMRAAIEQCPPDEYADSTVEGVPRLKFRAEPVPEDQLTGVADDRVAAEVTYTDESGKTDATTLIYQRRGDVMIASYSDDPDRAIALAVAAGKRLADADPEDLAG
jgi:hypothetical protein